MAVITFEGMTLTGDHASRPAFGDVGVGSLYACSDHSLIYQSDGSAWSTWATLGAGGGVEVEDEGTPLATTATTLDFVGSGVTASGTGATKTITIPGGGGGGGPTGVRYPIQTAIGVSSSSSTRAVTIAAAPTTSTLIVVTAQESTHAVSSIACTNGTFTKLAGTTVGVAPVIEIWKGVIAGGASGTTVTVTYAGTNFCNAVVMEWDALAATLETSASRNVTTDPTGSHPIPIVTPADTDALVIAGVTTTNNSGVFTQFRGPHMVIVDTTGNATLGVMWGFPGTNAVYGVTIGGSSATASGCTASLL